MICNSWVIAAEFIDESAGGEIAIRLARASEIEIIMPKTGDHATVTAEVSHACITVNLQVIL